MLTTVIQVAGEGWRLVLRLRAGGDVQEGVASLVNNVANLGELFSERDVEREKILTEETLLESIVMRCRVERLEVQPRAFCRWLEASATRHCVTT